MTWVAAGVSVGTSLLGGFMSNKANKKAAGASAAAAQQGIGRIDGFYNDAKSNMSPYMQTGQQANAGVQSLLGGDYSSFYNSPDFQARLQAGGQMFDSSAAARGGVFGGGATRAREMYGQNLAQQGLGDYRNWLGGVAGQGQNAASNLGQMGMGAGNSIAQLLGGAGAAQAGAYQANGMNNAGMLGSLGNAFGSAWGNRAGGNSPGATGPAGVAHIQPMFTGNGYGPYN